MPYQPILGTLGYILSPDGKQVLMVHRIARPEDEHLGKYNGLGGKLDPDEDIVTGMIREIREEAGIVPTELSLRGTISWPGFGKQGEDWFGFIFLISAFDGEPYRHNPEGRLEWVDLGKVVNFEVPMWEGDRYFLDLVFDDDPRAFHGVMPYRSGLPISWSYTRL